jgi:pimeloyl-ACP methyl ester carboxylesterase
VGAYLALLLAAREPALVERLLLIQAPSWREVASWTRRIDFRGRGHVARPWFGQLLVLAGKRQIAQRWFTANASSESRSRLCAITRDSYRAGAHFALASLVQAYFGGPSPDLGSPSQPAVIVWGEQDSSHRETDSRSMLEHVPHAEWVAFAGAGHCPEIEAPEQFATLI